jgi:hypothetical protein
MGVNDISNDTPFSQPRHERQIIFARALGGGIAIGGFKGR